MATVGKIAHGLSMLNVRSDAISWRAKLSFSFLMALWAYAFFPSLQNIVQDATKVPLNQHCMFVLPLFIGLLLSKRGIFMRISPSVSYFALFLLLVLSCGWIFASISSIKILQQICTLAIVPAIFMLAFGYKITKYYIFPLSYLLLMLPIGHLIIPKIQTLLSASLVRGFVYADLPVYWEQQQIRTIYTELNFIEFSKVLNFLLVFFAFGCLYAYLMVFSQWRRIMVAATFIVAPCLLLFGMVYGMLAYELKVGSAVFDPKMLGFYSWGCVIIGLGCSILLGVLLKQHKPYYDTLVGMDWQSSWQHSDFNWLRPSIIAAGILLLAPLLLSNVHRQALQKTNFASTLHAIQIPHWLQSKPGAVTNWQPSFKHASAIVVSDYCQDQQVVRLFVADYVIPKVATRIFDASNSLYHPKIWRVVKQQAITTKSATGKTTTVLQTLISNNTQHLLVWHYYYIGNFTTTNKLFGRLLDSLRVLLNLGPNVGVVALATKTPADFSNAEQTLKQFWLDANMQIAAAIEHK